MTVPRVHSHALGREVSALGFGCASLGSRVAPAEGVAALARAWDRGVTWFDVAPSYGDGEAERLLGHFLRDRRSEAQIVTKVGLAASNPGLMQRMARPALRTALRLAPGLRPLIRKRRPAASKVPLTPERIRQSIDASLMRLGTEYVDVLALHAVSPDQVGDPAVIEMLAEVVRSGKARAIGIASSVEAAVTGVAASPIYKVAQFENNIVSRGGEAFAANGIGRQIDVVTHSVYGTGDNIRKVSLAISESEDVRRAAKAAGYGGSALEMARAIMADFSFKANSDGVVIVSMFKADNLDANVSRRDRMARRPEDAALYGKITDICRR